MDEKRIGTSANIPVNTDVYLDPNHSHFILVDDGSEGSFGKEIAFRAQLENELCQGRSLRDYQNRRQKSTITSDLDFNNSSDDQKIPIILIVVQGGPYTLLTVEETLKKNKPVLVLAVEFKNIIKYL